MPPPVLRKRNSSVFSLNKGDIEAKKKEKENELGFSDDDDSINDNAKDEGTLVGEYGSKVNFTNASTSNLPSDITNDVINQTHFSAEAEEVEDDVEMFNKAIHISNLEQVDHADLLRRMHKRFKKKVRKWEYMSYKFTWYSFMMSFTILVIQVVQMIIHQFTGSLVSERDSLSVSSSSGGLLQRIGLSKKSASVSEPGRYQASSGFTNYFQSLQTAQGVMSAITALVAGLQLKLKLNAKAERYRRGAKVYGRLLRISTYYIMMLESGGKIEDVTGLWKEAMKKEGKWIPLVRTFMPL